MCSEIVDLLSIHGAIMMVGTELATLPHLPISVVSKLFSRYLSVNRM